MILSRQIVPLFLILANSFSFAQVISLKSNQVTVNLQDVKKGDTLAAPTIKWETPLEEAVTLKDGRFTMRVLVTSQSKLKQVTITLKEKQGDEEIFVKKLESGIVDVSRNSLLVEKTYTFDRGVNVIEVEVENANGIKSKSSKLAYVNLLQLKEKKNGEKANPSVVLPEGPVTFHPLNPHYFLYNKKPTILVGASEHYGAVVNKAFDFKKYLETVSRNGLNYVRVYGGTYVEKVGDFGIQRNTLAPAASNLVLPWKRSETPGYFLGGNKFDISQWDENYFSRLKDFLSFANEKNIIVEFVLFSSFYGSGWKYSPFNPSNNINKTNPIKQELIHTLNNGNIINEQEKYVRKIVNELNGFDNLYFEIQNEPWADQIDTIFVTNEYDVDKKWTSRIQVVSDLSKTWQAKVSDWIKDEEKLMAKKHLISEDVSNFSYPIAEPNSNVDVFNFHYATRQSVQLNYYLNRPIGFNETGFAGKSDLVYRRQAWRFLMEGGAVFNQLDFSFSVGKEIGNDSTYKSPGGGSIELRSQLGVMKSLFDRFDFPQLRPDKTILIASPSYQAQAIGNGKDMWMIYLESMSTKSNMLQLSLQDDKIYEVEWMDVSKGKVLEKRQFAGKTLKPPATQQDKVAIIRLVKPTK